MAFLIFFIAALLAAAIFFSPWIAEELRRVLQAYRDYATCRGTQHAREIRKAIRGQEALLRPLLRKRQRARRKYADVDRKRVERLRRVLVRGLMRENLEDIAGIGPKLRRRVYRTCFDGSLDSLLSIQAVQGIGEQKADRIRRWVKATRNSIPELLKGEFEGKARVNRKYARRLATLRTRCNMLERDIRRRKGVIRTARTRVEALAGVTMMDFYRALRGNASAAARVSTYTLGAFAEWEPVPQWYRSIMAKPRSD